MNLEHRLFPTDRRVRAIFGGATLADSPAAWMGVGGYRPPVYELGTWWFDRSDVRMDLLEASQHRTVCEVRGPATYWPVVTGARRGENLAYAYADAPDGWEELRNLITFWWNDIDHWYEEDEEVFVHPRGPNRDRRACHPARWRESAASSRCPWSPLGRKPWDTRVRCGLPRSSAKIAQLLDPR